MEPQQHIVLIGNEMNQALFNNKEVWHMDLPEEAHMLNTCTWSFPAEAPSARPFVGSLRSEANSPNPQSLDPDVQAKGQLLKAWREAETTCVTYENSIPAHKRARMALTPRGEEHINPALRKIQTLMVTPEMDRRVAPSP